MVNPNLIKTIAIAVAGVGSAVVVTIVLTSKAKDRAYKEFLKTHDEEMAKELSKSFNKRIDSLSSDLKKSVNKFKAAVNDLCGQYPYNIAPVFA